MRRILVAVAFGLLTFASSAWADGPIVRWDRVEGVIGADLTPINVGPIMASGRWRTTGEGRVMLNLETGLLSARVDGISCAKHYPNCPIGSPAGVQPLIATVVCNSTGRFGSIEWVDTPTMKAGVDSLSYEGFLSLPSSCRDYPEELAFLIRHTETAPFWGSFVLYGAERSIQ